MRFADRLSGVLFNKGRRSSSSCDRRLMAAATAGVEPLESRVMLSASYLVKAVNSQIYAHLTTSSVADNTAVYGPADANGFIQVTADNEIDAIDKGIVASATSTAPSAQYQFFTGVNSDKFTVTPASPSDGLNYKLNLQNGTYTGSASIQVRPLVQSLIVADAANQDNVVTPPAPAPGQAVAGVPLYVVADPVSGVAQIALNGTLSVDDATHRGQTKWTLLTNNTSTLVSSGSLSADGSDTFILLPAGATSYTLKFGYDLDRNGILSAVSESQGMVQLQVVTHAAFSVSALPVYATSTHVFSGTVGTFEGDSASASANFSANINWGDGTTSTGTITGSAGSYSINGTHTYSTAGTNVVTLKAWSSPGQGSTHAASGTSTSYVRDASLVADWQFADGASDDAGTYFSDTSVSGNTATLSGARWSVGVDGYSGASFYGTGQSITIADNATLDPTSGITVSASFNARDWSNASATLLQKGNGAYSIAQVNGQLVFSINTTNGVQQVGVALPSTNAWHQLVASYDGSSISLTIDGATTSASASGTISTDTGTLMIGDKAGSSTTDDAFAGIAQSVSVYSAALSPNQLFGPVAPDARRPTGSLVTVTSGSQVASLNINWVWPTVVTGRKEFKIFWAPVGQPLPRHALLDVMPFGASVNHGTATSFSQRLNRGLTAGTQYQVWIYSVAEGTFGTPTPALGTAKANQPGLPQPTDLQVRLYSPGSAPYPSEEKLQWKWAGSGPVTWQIFRDGAMINTASSVTYDSAAGVYSCKDQDAILTADLTGNDPKIHHYSVTALSSGITSIPSQMESAAQIFYFTGNGDTGHGGLTVQQFYEGNAQGVEFHYFPWYGNGALSSNFPSQKQFDDNAYNWGTNIESKLLQSDTLILAGFSYGGATAQQVANEINSPSDPAKPSIYRPVDYLALIDPVPYIPQGAYPDPHGDPTVLGNFAIPPNVGETDDWYNDSNSGSLSIISPPVVTETYSDGKPRYVSITVAASLPAGFAQGWGVWFPGESADYEVHSVDDSTNSFTIQMPDGSFPVPTMTAGTKYKQDAVPSSPSSGAHVTNYHPIGTVHGSQPLDTTVTGDLMARLNSLYHFS